MTTNGELQKYLEDLTDTDIEEVIKGLSTELANRIVALKQRKAAEAEAARVQVERTAKIQALTAELDVLLKHPSENMAKIRELHRQLDALER